MPELPDLQVFAKNLHKKLAGKKLEKITLSPRAKINVPAKTLHERLEGQVLNKVSRVGKRLFFYFNSGNILALHLLLNGELQWYDKSHEVDKFIIDLHFAHG